MNNIRSQQQLKPRTLRLTIRSRLLLKFPQSISDPLDHQEMLDITKRKLKWEKEWTNIGCDEKKLFSEKKWFRHLRRSRLASDRGSSPNIFLRTNFIFCFVSLYIYKRFRNVWKSYLVIYRNLNGEWYCNIAPEKKRNKISIKETFYDKFKTKLAYGSRNLWFNWMFIRGKSSFFKNIWMIQVC